MTTPLRALLLGTAPALVLAAFVFAACGGDDDNGDTTATTAAGSPAASETASAEPSARVSSPTAGTNPSAVSIALEEVVTGFSRPTFVTAPANDERLFVLEKRGVIRIVEDGQIAETAFLDIEELVRSDGNEQGLLGMAFHPEYAENGRFFVYYTGQTDGAGDNTVAEYQVTANPSIADPTSARVLLAIADFAGNHNGGMLAFGPDGYLYVGTGDGGQAGDPRENGQNTDALLGKILRIDVDASASDELYGIPADNPFAAGGGAPEVWAYGLRNPWRFSFDRETGDLYIADVGQNKWEEVNFQPADSKGGENYGWRLTEGPDCFQPASGCDREGQVEPVAVYDHAEGCSITGGYVYRGAAQDALRGIYLYADYCSGTVWALPAGAEGEAVEVATVGQNLSSFGEGSDGELYAVGDRDGGLYRVVSAGE